MGYARCMRTMLRLVGVGLVAGMSVGCATRAMAPQDWAQVVEEMEGKTGAVRAEEWATKRTQAGRFDVLEGEGKVVERRVEEGEGERWRVVSTRDGEKWVEETFAEGEGGTVLVESVSHEEGVITRFEPPLLVAPRKLAQGEAETWKGMMRIHPIDRPDEVRDEGEAEQEVRLAGSARVRLASGVVEAGRVETTLRVTLKGAKVETTTTVWVSEGVGVAAERARERATFLGLSVRDVRRALVRR